MTVVADASLVVAALVDSGSDGAWAEEIVVAEDLAAPHHMPAEVAGVLRRAELSGAISADVASQAHADLLSLRVALFPYETFGDRVWVLRSSVTIPDAWYVALAETIDAPLATLDARLASVNGPRCRFVLPPWARAR